VHLFHKVFDSDVLCQLPAACVVGVLDSQSGAEAIEHSNNLSRPALGKQIHLKIQMIPTVGDDAHPVLLYQHKRRDQDRFQRGN